MVFDASISFEIIEGDSRIQVSHTSSSISKPRCSCDMVGGIDPAAKALTLLGVRPMGSANERLCKGTEYGACHSVANPPHTNTRLVVTVVVNLSRRDWRTDSASAHSLGTW